ncbi:hypothetical protein EZ242_02120 [Ramlibacter rhizophilus]|uniref:ATP-dependent DNA ligase family profile domain-containing protein n=1 Tax=Ramlibacter rhizophilus TaxID=1781167 RepID=A0A4Z0BYZ5_9BURK|nr:hypothetical protein EZ242_02120 [Ramlibacter rhizophilus]
MHLVLSRDRARPGSPARPHVIDGEACVLREDGTSDINQLQSRARRRRRVPGAPPVTLCCFDLLVCNGKPPMHLPLTRRKKLLRELIALIDDPKRALLFVQDLPADADLFQSMTLPKNAGGLGLEIEGVVAERRNSSYRPGVRSDDGARSSVPGGTKGDSGGHDPGASLDEAGPPRRDSRPLSTRTNHRPSEGNSAYHASPVALAGFPRCFRKGGGHSSAASGPWNYLLKRAMHVDLGECLTVHENRARLAAEGAEPGAFVQTQGRLVAAGHREHEVLQSLASCMREQRF